MRLQSIDKEINLLPSIGSCTNFHRFRRSVCDSPLYSFTVLDLDFQEKQLFACDFIMRLDLHRIPIAIRLRNACYDFKTRII